MRGITTFQAVLIFALAAAVAVLILASAGGMFPSVKQYGEPMPYVTFKNTSRGIQLGVFDYAGYTPKAAFIYVNGRYAGSASSFSKQGNAVGAWTDVYVKCGDWVEALVQYDGFQRKFEGRVRCSKPLRSSAASSVSYFGSRTAMEAVAAISHPLGIEVNVTYPEMGCKPTFYVKVKGALALEYQQVAHRYRTSKGEKVYHQSGIHHHTATGEVLRLTTPLPVDRRLNDIIYGVLRAYKPPPYGYTVSDYQSTRDLPLNFIVNYDYLVVNDLIYTSTYSYVEINGERHFLGSCVYSIYSSMPKIETETYTRYETVFYEPNAAYEVFIVPEGSKNVYRATFAFYTDNKAMRLTVSKVNADPQAVLSSNLLPAKVEIKGKTYYVVGNDASDAIKAFLRFAKSADKIGLDPLKIYDELRDAMAAGEAYDKTFGKTWEVKAITETQTKEKREVVVVRDVKTTPTSGTYEWIAMTGVFKGLTAGGWDVFINMAPNKAVLNSTTPPIVLTIH